MNYGIGIDTGGTYTDAVLLDMDTGAVLRHAKALTTKHRLSVGIDQALAQVIPRPEEVSLVSLSTTLATNALVEGQGAPVCLLLLGYDQASRSGRSLAHDLGTSRYVFLPGGHDIDGQELAPLDLEATRAAILANAPDVGAFAVSGYFGTRNPDHEQTVQDLVTRLTGLPTTAGHELTQELDAMRRATTATLNATLIPMVCELVSAVEEVLRSDGVDAPLMLVKGDGSLIRAEVAQARPIETILSGPAASVVGAQHLVRSADAIVVDMGGTTTDIAMVEHGQPRLEPSGARVGNWHTMVEAIDMQTVGLGGDSQVHLAADGTLAIGPRRAVPLCLLAHLSPQIEDELARAYGDPECEPAQVEFMILERPRGGLTESQAVTELLRVLERGPLSRRQVDDILHYPALHQTALARLVRQGIIARSAMTPTDAAHVLGLYAEWNTAASNLAMDIWARALGLARPELARRILDRTSARIAQEIARKAWDEDGNGHRENSALSDALLGRIITEDQGKRMRLRPMLQGPIVGLGAPAGTYFPGVAGLLNARVELPPLGHVANAIGAIVGSVVSRSQATVLPASSDQGYTVQTAFGVTETIALEDAVALARSEAQRDAMEKAAAAGAMDIRLETGESTSTAPVGHGYSGEVFISTTVNVQAIGRPRLARSAETF